MQTEISTFVKNDSYKKTQENPVTGLQRSIIYKILQGHPEGITDLEICILTGISRSSVCARRNEIPNVCAVGIAKIHDENYGDRFNTLWSVI